MTAVLDISENIRKRGDVTVIAVEGCERRGNGSAWAPLIEGHINHHTGGGNNIYYDKNLVSGVPGLSGPLCNWAILYDGDLAIIAAFPANHAGASGGWDTAPLTRTNDFNRRVLGTEIQYRGVEPMSAAQWRTMCVLNYEIARYFKWPDFSRCKTHNGTSVQGKWDPGYAPGKTYDIAKMRRDFAAIGPALGGGENEDSEEFKFLLAQTLGKA
jgi:hypothetical protein